MNVVKTSTARDTGTRVAMIDNRDGSFEAHDGTDYPEEMQWATLCEHGNYVLHRTRQLAQDFMAAPHEFCSTCYDIAIGESTERVAIGDRPWFNQL